MGFAVGGGVGRAGSESLAQTPSEKAGDGLTAAVAGVENLGEEHPHGHGGVKEPVAEADLFVVDGLLDLIGQLTTIKGIWTR